MMITSEFAQLVDDDLKRKPLSDGDRAILEADPTQWLDVLLDFKGEVEIQFVNMRVQALQKRLELVKGEISEETFLEWQIAHETRHLNRSRLLKSIETKMKKIKNECRQSAEERLRYQTDAEPREGLATLS